MQLHCCGILLRNTVAEQLLRNTAMHYCYRVKLRKNCCRVKLRKNWCGAKLRKNCCGAKLQKNCCGAMLRSEAAEWCYGLRSYWLWSCWLQNYWLRTSTLKFTQGTVHHRFCLFFFWNQPSDPQALKIKKNKLNQYYLIQNNIHPKIVSITSYVYQTHAKIRINFISLHSLTNQTRKTICVNP